MTPTTAYLIGWDMCSAYRSIIDRRPDLVDAMLVSAQERLDRAVREGVKDHEADFVGKTRDDIRRYAAQSAALKGGPK